MHVVDTTAPTSAIEKIADMEKGDKLNISDVKVNAEDKSGIDKVWLNEILYSRQMNHGKIMKAYGSWDMEQILSLNTKWIKQDTIS